MNARAYRHSLGISRMMVINAACTMLVVVGMAYIIAWPALAQLYTLAHSLPAIGVH